jgi:NRAMP (natural resistance-associated macrophage protein)-like metal ion transporter
MTQQPRRAQQEEAKTTGAGAGEGPRRAAGNDSRDEASKRGWKGYLKALGPGLVTGAADDDPSGIATYAQAGALYRYDLLWTLLMCLPLMVCVQVIADRTALATGKSLGALALQKYGARGRLVVGVMLIGLLAANVLNMAADVAAVGAGMNLLHAGPAWVWALAGGFAVLILLVRGSFRLVARVFNALALSLFVYVAVVAFAHPGWSDVASHLFVPHVRLDKGYAAMVVAILGTTISPYMLFWQSGHRIEEMREEPVGGDKAAPLKRRSRPAAQFKRRAALLDVIAGMAFSQIIALSIMIATANTLGAHHNTSIQSAAQAAAALRPVAGRYAELFFALGFIGSGMLAIPVLVGSASIGISGLLGKEWGFSRPFREAPFFYWLIIGGTLLGTVLSVLPINVISLLVLSAVVNGVLAPAFLVLLMLIGRDRRLIGSEVHMGRVLRWGGWLTAAVMGAAAVLFLVLTFL